MSESPTTGQELTTQPPQPARPVREYRVVENALGIMDTARFEHLGRVATVLAKAQLLPDSLTKTKENGAEVWLPYETIQARAFLIANQADLFGMDPNALAQCVSIVHGKLMYEGKLVHALISAKLGVDLEYLFGRYDPRTRDIVMGELPAPDDQSLGVRVIGTLPGEAAPRTISGSVAMWHKGAKSPWGESSAWPRQLRYMGAREWVRAHKPSLLLGILTEDEVDEYEIGRQVGALAPAAPQPLHAGFEDQRPAQLLPPEVKDEPAPRQRKARAKAQEPAQDLPPHNPTTGEILQGDDIPHGAKGSFVISGPAPAGVLHFLEEACGLDTMGMRLTFKDGERWSTAKPDADLPTYAELAPAKAEAEQQPGPTATDGAQAAASEPATSASATPASTASAGETSSQADTATKSDAGAPDDDDLPPDLQAYVDKVEAARDFDLIKGALKEFQATQYWKDATDKKANSIRRNTWQTMEENFAPEALPKPESDVSAFRLWVEAQDEPESIVDGLAALEANAAFQTKSDAMKENMRGAADARIQALEP